MSFALSNHQKVVFINGNILDENVKFSQNDCQTVRKFDYNFERTCNSKGVPFGMTTNPIVEFSLRFMDELAVKPFFSLLNSMEIAEFSFLFGASFDGEQKIDGYDNAIVARGYVVEVVQDYFYNEFSDGELQRRLNIKFLAAEMTYVGTQSNKTLLFSKRI